MSCTQTTAAEVRNKTKNVLIGSCGGLTGIYLAKQYGQDDSLFLVGSDCSNTNAGKFFVDEFAFLPHADDPLFLDKLVDVLNLKKIDIYIPTHSSEIKFVAQHENVLRNLAPCASFAVCPYETFLTLDDKELMHENFFTAGLPVPRIYRDAASVETFPCFMKRRVGSGGAGSGFVLSPQAFVALSGDYPDALFFELIDGFELTIDCMFDDKGSLVSYNQRRRIKTLGGAAIISKNDFSVDIEPYLKTIASSWIFKGCVNFQCIVRDGQPFFTDVNLRFPSGGLPLTVESGVNVPRMMIDLLSGLPLKACPSDRLPRTMYRYFDELFTVE